MEGTKKIKMLLTKKMLPWQITKANLKRRPKIYILNKTSKNPQYSIDQIVKYKRII